MQRRAGDGGRERVGNMSLWYHPRIESRKVAKMESAGSGHLFPTKVFHRSGTAPRRCIKIVFFYSLKDIQDLDEMDVDANTASTCAGKDATEAKVKTEGKDATEGEETEDKKGDDEKNAEAEMETKLDQKDGAAVTEEEEEGKSKPETKEKDGLDDANAVKPQETTVPDEKNAESEADGSERDYSAWDKSAPFR